MRRLQSRLQGGNEGTGFGFTTKADAMLIQAHLPAGALWGRYLADKDVHCMPPQRWKLQSSPLLVIFNDVDQPTD